MNGSHDLGGRHGHGAVNPLPESEEPVFHAQWERRTFALTLATGLLGRWNIDESRYARERVAALAYLQNSYYGNWLEGLEKLITEKGLLDVRWQGPVPGPEQAEKLLNKGSPADMSIPGAPRFQTGDRVRVRKIQTRGHTRAPGYVQGVTGIIAARYGGYVFPDASSAGNRRGEQLYSVMFAAQDLWGSEAEASEIMVDLWQPYLEAAA